LSKNSAQKIEPEPGLGSTSDRSSGTAPSSAVMAVDSARSSLL
jgi:hypothetical protein